MKVIVFFLKAFISEWETPTWPPSIQMGVTAGIFLASILLKEMRHLVYIRYLSKTTAHIKMHKLLHLQFTNCRQLVFALLVPSCCNKFGTSC